MSDEKSKIKKDIEKSGLPLEIEVTSIIEKSGWEVQNQSFYWDEDEKKGRTIDITAFKALSEELGVYDRHRVALFIECKKSSTPWIFYTRHKTTDKGKDLFHTLGCIKKYTRPELKNFKWLAECHYSSSMFREQAIISYEAFKTKRIF